MPTPNSSTRRSFLAGTGRFAAASALAGMTIPQAHVLGRATIRVALVGCGGRGRGAAVNALSVEGGQLRLVAAADVFEGKPDAVAKGLKEQFGERGDVPADQRFVGFDAYRKAMDCLLPGDIVILTTPPAFRWVHYTYAIEKGLNVFMEKPVCVDGPSSKRMLALNEKAKQRGLKVGVGLMSRHNDGMEELQKRIQDGEIGEITFMRGYRMHGPAGFFRSTKRPDGITDLMYQIKRFHSFLWASGGNFSDFNIHIIDHLCWMKNAWPVRAHGVGGRHYKKGKDGVYIDQNFDSYGVEYTFDDGTKMFFEGRCMEGCRERYKSYAHGTKGMAIVSKHGDCGLPSGTFRNHKGGKDSLIWRSNVPPARRNPYQNEWGSLVDAINADRPYNEVERGVMTSVVTAMGRMAVHVGQVVTLDDIQNKGMEFAPNVDKLDYDQPAPLQPLDDGTYPTPMPGQKEMREY